MRRNTEIRIEQATTSRHAGGRVKKTWPGASEAPFATEFGEAIALSGDELYLAQQTNPKLSWKVKIPERSDLTSDMRLLVDGRYLEITAVIPKPGIGETHLMCAEWTD